MCLLSDRRSVLVTDPTPGIPTAGILTAAHLNGCQLLSAAAVERLELASASGVEPCMQHASTLELHTREAELFVTAVLGRGRFECLPASVLSHRMVRCGELVSCFLFRMGALTPHVHTHHNMRA